MDIIVNLFLLYVVTINRTIKLKLSNTMRHRKGPANVTMKSNVILKILLKIKVKLS